MEEITEALRRAWHKLRAAKVRGHEPSILRARQELRALLQATEPGPRVWS